MILLVSNSLDFTTDYIVQQLRARSKPYQRLDIDRLADDHVRLDPVAGTLAVDDGLSPPWNASIDSVEGVLFRAPTYLRESSGSMRSPESLLVAHQWQALARSLVVFDRARWLNHPTATYLAEIKPFQLRKAAELGLAVPHTICTNTRLADDDLSTHRVALKAIDTFYLRTDSHDLFFYTQAIDRAEIDEAQLHAMPVLFQDLLHSKTDIRATIIGQHVYSAAVLESGHGIDGDWRLAKSRASFVEHDLPDHVATKCVSLVRELGLAFGAVDLALHDGRYYFLEVNPTGEWAWLVDHLNFPIAERIADFLCGA